MIRVVAGDLLSVYADGRWYYALVLDRVRLFGGNWVFVFHRSSETILPAAEVLGGPGFHAFVDFIWAKREDRLERVAKGVDTTPYHTVRALKETHALPGTKAHIWFIYDPVSFTERGRRRTLTPEERRYPLYSRIDDTIMVDLAKRGWTPDQDDRL